MVKKEKEKFEKDLGIPTISNCGVLTISHENKFFI